MREREMTVIAAAFRVACVGLAIPTLWMLVYQIKPEWLAGLLRVTWMNDVVLLVWPSSLMLLGDAKDASTLIPMVSIAFNGLLYFIVAAALIFGFRKSLTLFYTTIVACLALAIFLVRI